jgi:hypothetical protein
VAMKLPKSTRFLYTLKCKIDFYSPISSKFRLTLPISRHKRSHQMIEEQSES